MLEEIAAHDYNKARVSIIQLLEVQVFDGVIDLIRLSMVPIFCRLSVLCRPGVVVGLGGPRRIFLALWGILPVWAGWPTLW